MGSRRNQLYQQQGLSAAAPGTSRYFPGVQNPYLFCQRIYVSEVDAKYPVASVSTAIVAPGESVARMR